MISETGHNFTSDWWAVGILIYEMLIGIPPFYHKNKPTMYKMIMEKEPRFPDPVKHGIGVSEQAEDLIRKLLNRDPAKRLGYESGANEILEHPFFDELDIDDLMEKKIKAEYIPEIKEENKYDLEFFDKDITELEAKESFIDEGEREEILNKISEYKEKFEEIGS